MTSRKTDGSDRQRGIYLKKLRIAANLSQAEVAEFIGVSTQQYGKYERGENRTPINKFEALIPHLAERDVSLHYRSQSGAGTPSALESIPSTIVEDPNLFIHTPRSRSELIRALETLRRQVDVCLDLAGAEDQGRSQP